MGIASEFFNTIRQSMQKHYGFTGLFILISLILLVSLSACNRKDLWENDSLDGGILPEVTLRTTTADSTTGQIDITWEDPISSIVDHIEVESVFGTSPAIAPGVQTYTINGTLTPSTPYTITIRTADAFGTTSTGVTFTVIPLAGGTTNLYIYTADDLNAVRGGEPGYSTIWRLDANCYLMADIDLTAAGYSNWTPIGDDPNPFTGNFEGNNHTISNLTINASASYQGLFGYINGGSVQNLTLSNVSIVVTGAAFVSTGSLAGCCIGDVSSIIAGGTLQNTSTSSQNIGGLIGELSGTISDCIASVNVTGVNRTGGLVGIVSIGSTITSSHSTGSVSGADRVGGFIGFNEGSITGTLGAECYAIGAVNGSNTCTGGFIGQNNGGALTYCFSSGTVQGMGMYIGGLIGRNSGALSNCHALVNVTGTGADITYIGGLAGRHETGAITGTTYATGDVTVTGTNSRFIGGLVGYTNTDINGLYAEGDIIADIEINTTGDLLPYIGGLAGFTDNVAVTGSHATGGINATIMLTAAATGTISTCVGGLIGYAYSTGTPNNISGGCYSTGAINASITGTTGIRYMYAGGLVGYNTGAQINGCYHTTGSIDVSLSAADYVYTGGLVGYIPAGAGEVSSCYVAGITVRGDVGSTSSATATGGLIGYSGVNVSGCTATITVNGSYQTGGLVGFNEGTVTNCHTPGGTVTGSANTGGLVGFNATVTSVITGCSSSCDVEGPSSTGGLVGNSGYASVTDSFAGGYVSGTSNTGGFAGVIQGTTTNCYATGDVTGTDERIGGFVGFNMGGNITLCYATGRLLGPGGSYKGGFVGRNQSAIQNCYSRGSVNGADFLGGFAGEITGGTISNIYSTGEVQNTVNYGGIVSLITAGTIDPTTCFFDTFTTFCDNSGIDGTIAGTASSTDPMTTMYPPDNIYTLAGWDFAATPIWIMDGATNDRYPFFAP